MYIYSFPISSNLSKVSAPVRQMIDCVNDSMVSFGFHEKMVIRSVVLNIELKSETKLNDEALNSFRQLSQKHLEEKFPEYEYIIEPLENIKIIYEIY